jgi:hypothetical protein
VGIDVCGLGGGMLGVVVITIVLICFFVLLTFKHCRLSKKTRDCSLSRMNAKVATVVS